MSDAWNGRLLNGVSAAGNGPVLSNPGRGVVFGSFQLEVTGAPTRVVVSVHALVGGATFDTLLTLDTDQGYVAGEIASMNLPTVVEQIYASLDTLTGGVNPTVTCHFSARS